MRISGITIPDNKRLGHALTALYGVGHSRSLFILSRAKIDPMRKPPELTAEEENRIRTALETYKLEGDLKLLAVAHKACEEDAGSTCGHIVPEGGLVLKCLRARMDGLTVPCYQAVEGLRNILDQ